MRQLIWISLSATAIALVLAVDPLAADIACQATSAGSASTSSNHQNAGQAVIGPSDDGIRSLHAGIMPCLYRGTCSEVPGDYDEDCDVDQGDYELFEDCATGPDLGPVAPGCEDRDFDNDNDVDHDDFATFQGCLSGSDQPGDPACAS